MTVSFRAVNISEENATDNNRQGADHNFSYVKSN